MTSGISPKAKLAALIPFLATLAAIGVQWLVTGEYDRAELVTSLTGLSGAILAFVGAWLGQPGDVTTTIGPASDELLGDTPLSDEPIEPDKP